jgi:hypothetical protein
LREELVEDFKANEARLMSEREAQIETTDWDAGGGCPGL